MKTLKTIFTMLLAAVSISSCSSDNNDKPNSIVYPEENPLNDYLAVSGFNQFASATKNYTDYYEFGFSFKPRVTGKINAIIVKIPEVNSALKVTLWDADTKTPIKSETINIPAANVTIEKAITSIILIKDKEYFLTFNSNSWINRMKPDRSDAAYPITSGNLLITGYAWALTKAEVTIFPTIFAKNFYAGDITFKFQQIE